MNWGFIHSKGKNFNFDKLDFKSFKYNILKSVLYFIIIVTKKLMRSFQRLIKIF